MRDLRIKRLETDATLFAAGNAQHFPTRASNQGHQQETKDMPVAFEGRGAREPGPCRAEAGWTNLLGQVPAYFGVPGAGVRGAGVAGAGVAGAGVAGSTTAACAGWLDGGVGPLCAHQATKAMTPATTSISSMLSSIEMGARNDSYSTERGSNRPMRARD